MGSDETDDDEGAAFDSEDGYQGFRIPPVPSGADARYPGSEVLANGTPGVVMERLLKGDPLNVSQAVIDRMEDQAILLDARAVLRAAMARVAHDAYYYKGTPALREWINLCIDKGVHLVITQLTQAEQRGDPIDQDEVPLASQFMGGLGIERAMVRRALLHYQSLSLKVRRTFHTILVQGRTLEHWSAAGNGSLGALEMQLMHAAEVMGSVNIPAIPPQPGSKRAKKLQAKESGEGKKDKNKKKDNKKKRKGGGHA